MLTSQEYYAIKADIAAGMFQDVEEEYDMRQAVREYEDYREYCREARAEMEYERQWELQDARLGGYWDSYA